MSLRPQNLKSNHDPIFDIVVILELNRIVMR